MRLLRGSAANGYETVDSLSIQETSDYNLSSLVRTQNGHIFCTNSGFMNIYEVGLSRDGKKLELIKKHQTDAKNRRLTAATVGNIDYLFTSAEDKAVHLYRVDGSSFTEIYKFQCADPCDLLWIKERSLLLVSEWNVTLHSDSVRAFKFGIDMKKTVEEATVLNVNEGLDILSWIETGANEVTLFDGNKNDLVDLKVI